MLIDLIKFIHILLTLSLLGSLIYCMTAATSPSFKPMRFYRILLWLSLFAIITGTILVVPKHFTFHTPWIQAAYILVFLFASVVMFLKKIPFNHTWLLRSIYLMMLIVLVLIAHDAVTKTTFLFSI